MAKQEELKTKENKENEQSVNPSVVDEPVISPEEIQQKADELEKMKEDSAQKDAEELDKAHKELGIASGQESQEKSEIDFEGINNEIKNRLENIWLGGVDGEDIFGEADNLDEIMAEVSKTAQQASAENWSKGKFIEKLSGITVKMDMEHSRNLLHGSRPDSRLKPESKLGDFVDLIS